MSDRLPSANLPTVTRKIGEHRYIVTRLGYRAMLDALHRIQALAGPAVTGLLAADAVSLDDLLDLRTDRLGTSLLGLLDRVSGPDGLELQEILGRQTIVEVADRKVTLAPDAMDTWFSQHPEDALPWLAFAVEVQFRDFFEQPMRALGRKLADLAAKAPASRSPST